MARQHAMHAERDIVLPYCPANSVRASDAMPVSCLYELYRKTARSLSAFV